MTDTIVEFILCLVEVHVAQYLGCFVFENTAQYELDIHHHTQQLILLLDAKTCLKKPEA
jgi:hypothetical protein